MKEIGIPGLFSMTTCTHNYCSPYSLLLINLIINYISVYLIYYVGYQSVEYLEGYGSELYLILTPRSRVLFSCKTNS